MNYTEKREHISENVLKPLELSLGIPNGNNFKCPKPLNNCVNKAYTLGSMC